MIGASGYACQAKGATKGLIPVAVLKLAAMIFLPPKRHRPRRGVAEGDDVMKRFGLFFGDSLIKTLAPRKGSRIQKIFTPPGLKKKIFIFRRLERRSALHNH
jgi:hypothetical protein